MNDKYRKLIFSNQSRPLSTVPFHRAVPCIERSCPENFPVHIAVHKICDAVNVAEYTSLHSHPMHELNIVLGDDGALEYEVHLGDEKYTVGANSSIWIPGGLPHSTNVVRGSGYYIVVRFDKIPAEFARLPTGTPGIGGT